MLEGFPTVGFDKELRAKYQAALHEVVGSKYNISWPLPNLRPSSGEEFWRWRVSYAFDIEVWTQPRKIDDGWAHIMLYFMANGPMAGGGFAVVVQYSPNRTVTYYEWGKCEHKYTGKTIDNCLNRYTCSKCGNSYDVDSSD